jgi:hypothetical protein
MYLTKRVKVAAGVLALLGLATAGSAAFTATGLDISSQAAAPQFIGGTVNQAVFGNTLTNVLYSYADGVPGAAGTGSNTADVQVPPYSGNPVVEPALQPGTGENLEISGVTLTFASDNEGAAPTIVFSGSDTPAGPTAGEYTGWTCSDIGSVTDLESTCAPNGSNVQGYATNVTGIAVTLADANDGLGQ